MPNRLSHWSVRHPIGVIMLTLAAMVLGGFALGRLNVDLLPSIVYPDVSVRVNDPGVPARVMEDDVTRRLEEQLAITEGAVAIQSRTSEGRSAVDLSFRYGDDIDLALRDASARLDRARRFLPDSIEPPTIFKRDPFQLPVAEYVVGSPLLDPLELRDWVEYELAPLLVNLPGVAAAETGGGLAREVRISADQFRLAALGIDVLGLERALRQANRDVPAGRLRMADGEISGRTGGRLTSVEELRDLPLATQAANPGLRRGVDEDLLRSLDGGPVLRLGEVAEVIDGAAEERLRIRLDESPGIKLSIQKQPLENTVAVVAAVDRELARLSDAGLIPPALTIEKVDDQARFIRHALRNAASAALGGALLAMLVVFLFLGSLRRTLIIGSAIPIAVLVTFILMAAFGLSFNIMTLGGLALGVGMLVDSTIVMLENIERHQRQGETAHQAAADAASEVTGAIVAATSTNLAAVLPFLFIGGLVGLLFRELIFTISAAIVASLVVALTLGLALAARVPARPPGRLRRGLDAGVAALQEGYAWLLGQALRAPWVVPLAFGLALVLIVPGFFDRNQEFLPRLDEGDIFVTLTADTGIDLEQMDALTRRVEDLVRAQPGVRSVFSTVGGFVFGRSTFESGNRASLQVQLLPLAERGTGTQEWMAQLRRDLAAAGIPGLQAFVSSRGIRGIRMSRGDDDLSLRVQGQDLDTLIDLADQVAARLKTVSGLTNVQHSNEELVQELTIRVDRERAAAFGLPVEEIGNVVRFALEGRVITELIDGDRRVDVRLRLAQADLDSPGALESIVLFSNGQPIRLGDVAAVQVEPQPQTILRERQQRVVEVTAALGPGITLETALERAFAATEDLALPPGYVLYEAGNLEALQQGRDLGRLLLGLALFLVLVVMAVQYESLRNPLIIVLSVPFALIGVVLGLSWTATPLSMPVWLGLIMLAGIVVNNAIVLVEFIEQRRRAGDHPTRAILTAARLRLRPILMTTLTTVFGMLPLALAVGEGAELLQPLAITIVAGLAFSTLVSLLLVPMVYRLLGSTAHGYETRAEARR
ncbi:MAG: efflux RND transporter permease subunit [Chromatiaceae bacterium]|nr:MAG: efflux RND transporter permease subunit [Chromatiaceae bacterium]